MGLARSGKGGDDGFFSPFFCQLETGVITSGKATRVVEIYNEDGDVELTGRGERLEKRSGKDVHDVGARGDRLFDPLKRKVKNTQCVFVF